MSHDTPKRKNLFTFIRGHLSPFWEKRSFAIIAIALAMIFVILLSALIYIHIDKTERAIDQAPPGIAQSIESETDFNRAVLAGEVVAVSFEGRSFTMTITMIDESMVELPYLFVRVDNLYDLLLEHDVQITTAVLQDNSVSFFVLAPLTLFMMLSLIGFILHLVSRKNGGIRTIFVSKSLSGAGPRAISKSLVVMTESEKVTFDDIAGLEGPKKAFEEVFAYIENREKFEKLDVKMPSGILCVGEPGTGKTLIAKAAAYMADVPFLYRSGSDFVELYVGTGARRVRALFAEARKLAEERGGAIIFIDEIDAVGGNRGGMNNSEYEQTINALLTELGGIKPREGIVVIAATNRSDMLDPALTRSGRFDEEIFFPMPDMKAREEILAIHMKKKPKADNVDLRAIAQRTFYFSGADLANLANKAAMHTGIEGRNEVTQEDLLWAFDVVLVGRERPTEMSAKEKRLTALHETGHALLVVALKEADPPRTMSILPRSKTGGHVLSTPDEDRRYETRDYLIGRLAQALAGQAAEEHFFGTPSSGASGDLQGASKIATQMVYSYGMSPKIHRALSPQNISEAEKALADSEIDRILGEAREIAAYLIDQYADVVERVADQLIVKETFTGATTIRELFHDVRPISVQDVLEHVT